MTDDYTAWDSQTLNDLEANLRLAYRGIEDETNDLETSLEAKLHTWSGEDQATYKEKKADWEKTIQELNGILDRMGAAVKDIHENFTATERSNQTMFQD